MLEKNRSIKKIDLGLGLDLTKPVVSGIINLNYQAKLGLSPSIYLIL